MPEFTADYGLKSGEKVDYAVMRDGAPVMVFECKKVGDALDSVRASQLARYFVNTPARIAILTDGIVYKFFSDLDSDNIMDALPFLEVDVTRMGHRELQALGHFTKPSFNLDEARSVASDMKHMGGMKAYLLEIYNQPTEEFVRLLTRRVYSGPLFQSRLEHFTGLARLAFHAFFNDMLNDTLGRASALMSIDQADQPQEEAESDDAEAEASVGNRGIITTIEEVEGYELVKTILSDCVEPERVFMRDTRSYCGILLDNNNRKTICRLRFNSPTTKHLTIMGELVEPGKPRPETHHRVETVSDIANHAEELREVARTYLRNEDADQEG